MIERELDKMEMKILKTISDYSPYRFHPVVMIYRRLESFDLTIKAIRIASAINVELSSVVDILE